jgi:hypothetical protein
MVSKHSQHKFDASTPFYASVGAADLAVETLRKAAEDFDGKAVAAQVREQFEELVEELVGETKKAQSWLEARFETGLEELQGGARSLPARVNGFDPKEAAEAIQKRLAALQAALQEELKVLPKTAQDRFTALQTEVVSAGGRLESRVAELRGGVNKTVEEQVEELATRGRNYVAKRRDGSISGDVELLREDAASVRDVPVDVEEAAAEAAEEADAAQTLTVVTPAPAQKAPAAKKTPPPGKTPPAKKATPAKKAAAATKTTAAKTVEEPAAPAFGTAGTPGSSTEGSEPAEPTI